MLAYSWARNLASDDLRLHFPLSLLSLLVCFVWISVLALRLARRERVTSGVWLGLAHLPLALRRPRDSGWSDTSPDSIAPEAWG